MIRSQIQILNLLVPMGWALALAAPAAAVTLPATGQASTYTADKNDGINAPVAVPDDGTVRAGAVLSYTDNGDGTITDNNTGLIWEKKGDNGGLHDKDNGYVWTGNGAQETIWDWLDDVNAEGGTGFAGYNDWRIPNAKEMQSLVNYQSAAPMTSVAFQQGCVPGASVLTGSCTPIANYFSSTTLAFNTTMAWGVAFNTGQLGAFDKVSTLRVRAVRGGGSSPLAFPATGQTTAYTANKNDGIPGAVAVPDDGTVRAGAPLSFTDNGNGTLSDNNTGLIWEKKGDNNGLHDKDNNYVWSGNGATETIWDWLDDVNAEGGTGFAGFRDWRIPSSRELLSIVDFQTVSGVAAAFNTNCLPGISVLTGSCAKPRQPVWTSSSEVRNTLNFTAWYSGSLGDLSNTFKTSGAWVRAVRAGTP